MIKIFFDLDGTLIDYSKRNYFVYKLLAKKYKLGILPFKTYWKLKQSKIRITESQEFLEEFVKIIESPNALKKDKLFSFTKPVLKYSINKGYKLYLVSCRNSKERTLTQLKNLGIDNFFSAICLGKETNGADMKAEHVRNYIEKSDTVYVIGDTEDDILSAKKVKAISIAVLSGIRNKKTLLDYSPDYIVKDIRALQKIV